MYMHKCFRNKCPNEWNNSIKQQLKEAARSGEKKKKHRERKKQQQELDIKTLADDSAESANTL